MEDRIIDCLAYNGKVSIKCISSKEIVEKARKVHDLTPTASAALGRLLTITSIMGYELKEKEGSITNQLKGDGALGTLTAVGESNGNVKNADGSVDTYRLNVKNEKTQCTLKYSNGSNLSGGLDFLDKYGNISHYTGY